MSTVLRAVFTWGIWCGGVATLSTFSRHCHCVSGQCRRDCQPIKRQRPGSMWCRHCHINRCHSTNFLHSQLSIRWRWFLHTAVPHAFQQSTRRYGVATATATWSREDGSIGNTPALLNSVPTLLTHPKAMLPANKSVQIAHWKENCWKEQMGWARAILSPEGLFHSSSQA